MGHSIDVIDGEHTIPDETGGEVANVHQVRRHVAETAKDLIQERLQVRSRWSARDFRIANEKGQSQSRISLTTFLDSNSARVPA